MKYYVNSNLMAFYYQMLLELIFLFEKNSVLIKCKNLQCQQHYCFDSKHYKIFFNDISFKFVFKIWEDYVKFDSHLDERIKTPIYNKVNKEKVVFFMHHYLGIKRYRY